eukprot:g19712.t1
MVLVVILATVQVLALVMMLLMRLAGDIHPNPGPDPEDDDIFCPEAPSQQLEAEPDGARVHNVFIHDATEPSSEPHEDEAQEEDASSPKRKKRKVDDEGSSIAPRDRFYANVVVKDGEMHPAANSGAYVCGICGVANYDDLNLLRRHTFRCRQTKEDHRKNLVRMAQQCRRCSAYALNMSAHIKQYHSDETGTRKAEAEYEARYISCARASDKPSPRPQIVGSLKVMAFNMAAAGSRRKVEIKQPDGSSHWVTRSATDDLCEKLEAEGMHIAHLSETHPPHFDDPEVDQEDLVNRLLALGYRVVICAAESGTNVRSSMLVSAVELGVPDVEKCGTKGDRKESIRVELELLGRPLTVAGVYFAPGALCNKADLPLLPSDDQASILLGDLNARDPLWDQTSKYSNNPGKVIRRLLDDSCSPEAGGESRPWKQANEARVATRTLVDKKKTAQSSPDLIIYDASTFKRESFTSTRVGTSDHHMIVAELSTTADFLDCVWLDDEPMPDYLEDADQVKFKPSENTEKQWADYADECDRLCADLPIMTESDGKEVIDWEGIKARRGNAKWSTGNPKFMVKDTAEARIAYCERTTGKKARTKAEANRILKALKVKDVPSESEGTRDLREIGNILRNCYRDKAANVYDEFGAELPSKHEVDEARNKHWRDYLRARAQDPEGTVWDLSLMEVQAAIRKLENGRSPGHCAICHEMVKRMGPTTVKAIHRCFSVFADLGVYPRLGRRVNLAAVAKVPGGCYIEQLTRPVSLCSVFAKLFDAVMDRRMSLWLDGHLWRGNVYLGKREEGPVQPTYSTAYRQGYMKEFATILTVDAIYSGRRSSVILNDFCSGFDIMSHPIVLLTMSERGCPMQLIATTTGFLRGRKVRVPGARCYVLWVGEAQGSPFSGSCWNVYTIPTTEEIRVMDFIRRVSVYSDDVTAVTNDDIEDAAPEEAAAQLREAGLKRCIFFDDGKHKRVPYDAGKPNPRIITVKGKSLGVTFDGTFCFRTQGDEIIPKLERESDFVDAEKGWNSTQYTLLMSSFAVPAISSVSTAVVLYLSQAVKREIESRFAMRIQNRLAIPRKASTRLVCATLGLPSPMGLMLTECVMAFYKGVAAGVWKFYESVWDIPYVTPSEEMRGTPPKTQSQSQAVPDVVEQAAAPNEAAEEAQAQEGGAENEIPLGPEVDGTAEEIPLDDCPEGNPWDEGEAPKQNPLWEYCAEPWTHRLNRIALSEEFEKISEAARSLDFGRKYWRGVNMVVWHMDKMAKRNGIDPISQMKKQEDVDKARARISKINCEQARKDLEDPDTIVVATDGGADPELGRGSGGGVSWYLPPNPEPRVIPGADPDSFDGEGFAVVHHCEQMRTSMSPMILKTVKKIVFYVDANGLLQALDAFNDKSSPLVIMIVRSLEEMEQARSPGVVFEFRWTPGHMANPFNDYADYMATQGLCHEVGEMRGRAMYKKILTAPILRRIIREKVLAAYERSSAHPELTRRAALLGPYRPKTYIPPAVDRVLFQVWLGCPYPGQLGMASVQHGNRKTGAVPVMKCPLCDIPAVPSCDHFLFSCRAKGALERIRKDIFPVHLAGGGVSLEDRAAFIKNSPSKVLKFLALCAKEGEAPLNENEDGPKNFNESERIKFVSAKQTKKREESTVTDKVVEEGAGWISRHV